MRIGAKVLLHCADMNDRSPKGYGRVGDEAAPTLTDAFAAGVRHGSSNWFLTALGVVVLAVALAILGLGAANYSATREIAPACDGNCKQASLELINVYRNAIRNADSPPSGIGWADLTIAPGNNENRGRIVVSANSNLAILKKDTQEMISIVDLPTFFGGVVTDNTIVTFDPIHERFFASTFDVQACKNAANTTSPPSIARPLCVGVGLFGPQTFGVSGMVVQAIPANGCSALTNAAAVAGKIVMMQRGGCPFLLKAQNGQAAGAIGNIIYRVDSTQAADMTPDNPSLTSIPSIQITLADYNMITANLPVTVTMSGPAPTALSTTMRIAVSKTAFPDTHLDFWKYAFRSAIWNVTDGDFPAHATNADTFMLAAQNFGTFYPGYSQDDAYVGASICAINKADLMDGTGANELWQVEFPKTSNFYMPASTRTPLTDRDQPVFFVSIGELDSDLMVHTMNIVWGTSSGINSMDPVRVPMPTPIYGYSPPATIRQPLPELPIGMESLVFVRSAFFDGNSLWAVLSHNVSAVHTVVRWFEFDVTNATLNGQISLRQWGDINQGIDLDIAFPQIITDKDGNAFVGFVMTGTNNYITSAWTGRLKSDPLGTMRYPLQPWLQGNYTMYKTTENNRLYTYTGISIDPVDRKTVYMFNQMPDPNGVFLTDDIANQWTAAIGMMQINRAGPCPEGPVTSPKHNKIDYKAERRAVPAQASALATATADEIQNITESASNVPWFFGVAALDE